MNILPYCVHFEHDVIKLKFFLKINIYIFEK